ncbi:hypothetical protein HPB49_025884 [Dermacentor silvarum]|nr:hypothetical protein HPB49_025884 [Dermacentor silvarum]
MQTEWNENEYAPSPWQPTSEPTRYGEGGNLGVLSGRRHGRDDEVTPVPVKDVARIIGKGGSRIRELQHSSGAHIWVKKDVADNYFETKIKLSDPEEACRKARELIDAITLASLLPAIIHIGSQPVPREEVAAVIEVVVSGGEDAQVASMSAEEAVAFKADNNNVATNPVTTFELAFSNHPVILDEICENKFAKPSPIQSQASSILLQVQDLIGIAQTASLFQGRRGKVLQVRFSLRHAGLPGRLGGQQKNTTTEGSSAYASTAVAVGESRVFDIVM